MQYIYEPKGKAREYSPLALNIYNGCDHGCTYCYIPDVTHKQSQTTYARAREINLEKLKLEAENANEQVLLCFIGDPYCHRDEELMITRKILHVLLEAQTPVAILSKGGNRIKRDIDLFEMFNKIKVGTTLTFHKEYERQKYEPEAATWDERREVLQTLHEVGIRTFASIEPVISPAQSIDLIQWTLDYVDEYLIGKLNHWPQKERTINWEAFTLRSMEILKQAGKPFYIKKDLRDRCKFKIEAPHDEMDYLTLRREDTYPEEKKPKGRGRKK